MHSGSGETKGQKETAANILLYHPSYKHFSDLCHSIPPTSTLSVCPSHYTSEAKLGHDSHVALLKRVFLNPKRVVCHTCLSRDACSRSRPLWLVPSNLRHQDMLTYYLDRYFMVLHPKWRKRGTRKRDFLLIIVPCFSAWYPKSSRVWLDQVLPLVIITF